MATRLSGAPQATAMFRPRRNDVLVSVAADGVNFASLPLPISVAAELNRNLSEALAFAGQHDGIGAAAGDGSEKQAGSNRTDAAKRLLSDVEEWCQRTGIRESVIGHKLFLHPGFVGLLRKRLTLSIEKECAVRGFLSANPTGWRGELPKTHGNGTRPVYQ